MKQSKRHSFLEANFNTMFGLLITLFINSVVFQFPRYQLMNNWLVITEYTLIMTVASVGRNYVIRRAFSQERVIFVIENRLDKLRDAWYSVRSRFL